MKVSFKKYWFVYIGIIPFFIQFLIFQLIPTIQTFYYSFTDWNGIKDPGYVGFDNYLNLVNDYQFTDSFVNTILYWLICSICVISVSLFVALLLNSKYLQNKTLYKTLVMLPYICAPMAMGLIFGMLFDENAGLVNAVIKLLGGEVIPWLTGSRYARIPVCFLFVWRSMPWYTLIMLSGLSNIPEEYYESAALDGAGYMHSLFSITIPQLRRIVFFCFIMITVDTWKIFNEPYILSGPGYSNTSVFQLMYENGFMIQKLGYASAIGVILTLALLIISTAQFILRNDTGEM